jgi:hypothetical protein
MSTGPRALPAAAAARTAAGRPAPAHRRRPPQPRRSTCRAPPPAVHPDAPGLDRCGVRARPTARHRAPDRARRPVRPAPRRPAAQRRRRPRGPDGAGLRPRPAPAPRRHEQSRRPAGRSPQAPATHECCRPRARAAAPHVALEYRIRRSPPRRRPSRAAGHLPPPAETLATIASSGRPYPEPPCSSGRCNPGQPGAAICFQWESGSAPGHGGVSRARRVTARSPCSTANSPTTALRAACSSVTATAMSGLSQSVHAPVRRALVAEEYLRNGCPLLRRATHRAVD